MSKSGETNTTAAESTNVASRGGGGLSENKTQNISDVLKVSQQTGLCKITTMVLKHPTNELQCGQAHKWEDMKNVISTVPCAREGFLYGIGSGIAVGALRLFKGGSGMSAGNWAVGTFAAMAVVSNKLCLYHRTRQHAKAVSILEMQSKKEPAKVEGFQPSAVKDNQEINK